VECEDGTPAARDPPEGGKGRADSVPNPRTHGRGTPNVWMKSPNFHMGLRAVSSWQGSYPSISKGGALPGYFARGGAFFTIATKLMKVPTRSPKWVESRGRRATPRTFMTRGPTERTEWLRGLPHDRSLQPPTCEKNDRQVPLKLGVSPFTARG